MKFPLQILWTLLLTLTLDLTLGATTAMASAMTSGPYQSPFLKFQGQWKVKSGTCLENGAVSSNCSVDTVVIQGPVVLAQATVGSLVQVHQWNCDSVHCQDVQDATVFTTYYNSYIDDDVELVHSVVMYELNNVTYFSFSRQRISLAHPEYNDQQTYLATLEKIKEK